MIPTIVQIKIKVKVIVYSEDVKGLFATEGV